MSSSPAAKSSPLVRTFIPGGAGLVIWALPSSANLTRSCCTTVSVPSGIRSPVSTQVKEVAASCHTPAARGPALTAMPSIAARAERGAGQRAWTGTAVTLASPSRSGTCSAAGVPGQPAAAQASIHCA
jgi:hypothetical protein